jgi:predicted Rdx family selenoprotein
MTMTLHLAWQQYCTQCEWITRQLGHPSSNNQVQELGRDVVTTVLTLHPAITGIDCLRYTQQ